MSTLLDLVKLSKIVIICTRLTFLFYLVFKLDHLLLSGRHEGHQASTIATCDTSDGR